MTQSEVLEALEKWQDDEWEAHGSQDKRAFHASPRLGKSYAVCKHWGKIQPTRSIVIAPKNVCPQWFTLLGEYGFPVEQGYGESSRRLLDRLSRFRRGVLVLSDSLLAPNVNELKTWLGDGALAVDESHRFAGVSTRRGRAMRRLAWQAGYVRELTGTPAPNHLGNLWGQMVALDKETWGTSYERFAQEFLIRDAVFPSRVLGVRNKEVLQARLLQRATIVRREDILGPDDWQEIVRSVDLPARARAMYDRMAKLWVLDEPKLTAANAAVRLLRLQQITAGHLPDEAEDMIIKDLHSAKIDACMADLSEIVEEGSKAIVYYKFRREGENMQASAAVGFPRVPVYRLGGDTSVEEREEIYRAVEQDKGPIITVVQIQAGGIGRSFAEAKYEMFLTEDFSFAAHEQARDRIFKPGEQRVVTAYRCRNTVDEFVGKALDRKEDVHNAVRTADVRSWVYGN